MLRQLLTNSASKLEIMSERYNMRKALALPQDTTALEAMIAKASEVMQERCADACISFGESTDLVFGEEFAEEIRALPGVTLEDLTGGAA